MSGMSGTVAVVNATAPLTCADSAACQAASVDLVGYGAAVINEAAPATGASNTDSVQRKDAADSDDNAADFASGAPTPGATNVGGDGGGTGDGEPGPLRIHDIQGSSWLAAHNGEQVTNVPGIVTGVRPTGSSRGYWIQDPDPDSSPATSEGIFVFTSSPGVAVGDSVLVSGTVSDFYPLSSGDSVATTSNLSVTEIGTPTVIVLLARQRAAGARGHRPRHGARRLRPGPRRREHRVDADHAEPLGARLLGVARGHAGGGRRRPRGRPVQQLRRAVRHHQAGAGGHLPRRHRAPGRERHPVGPRRGRARRTAPTPASTSATSSPAPPSARSTTRSSAAT